MGKRIVLKTRIVFAITVVVSILTVIFVWLYGNTQGRDIIENSYISTSILFVCFFSFLATGLYKGIHLSDDVELVARKINKIELPTLSNLSGVDFDGGDGLGGFILGILVWIAVTFLLWGLVMIFDAVIWVVITALFATIYWIFYRALFYVFRNSRRCKSRLFESLKYAFAYSTLYIAWIYGLLLILQSHR